MTLSQGRLTAHFRAVGQGPEDRKLRDVAASITAVSKARRGQNRRGRQNGEAAMWDATKLTKAQELEYDSLAGANAPLEDSWLTDNAIKTVDVLSRFAKDLTCNSAQRRQIFALKNMVMLTLWKGKPSVYAGLWKHTSQATTIPCPACGGTGDAPDSMDRCPTCEGSAVRKRSAKGSVFSVFAVQGGGYSTTWHLPSGVTERLLGPVAYGDDLVSLHRWPSFDLRKTPTPLDAEEYEKRRSYLAWFVARSSG